MITEFIRATTVGQAAELGKKGYTFLAGGTQVNNASYVKYGHRVEKVVSLDALELGGIALAENVAADDGAVLTIGAGTTLQEIADSNDVPSALKAAAEFIPTRSVRNIATIGGNIGANRPDSYLIPTLIALEATVILANEGMATKADADNNTSSIRVEEYIEKGCRDLIIAIKVPALRGCCIAVKESRSHLALPVVSAAVSLFTDSHSDQERSKVSRAIVAAGCVAPHAIRLTAVEEEIVNGILVDDERGDELEKAIVDSITPQGDFIGSTEYKRYINSVVIADAIRRCNEEVTV